MSKPVQICAIVVDIAYYNQPQGCKYEAHKEIPTESVKMCKYGFHCQQNELPYNHTNLSHLCNILLIWDYYTLTEFDSNEIHLLSGCISGRQA